MAGIAAVGAYAPRFRLPAEAVADAWGRFRPRGIDRTAVPDADEDALTMAHAAARRALAVADREPDGLAALALGTSTPPIEEEELTARLRSALSLPADVRTVTHAGSTRAGVTATEAAVDADGPALAVAADCPRGDPDSDLGHAAGAGAVALLCTPDAPVGVVDRAQHTTPYPGTRTRPAGASDAGGLGITAYDRDAYTEPIVEAVEGLDAAPETADAFAVQAPDGDLPYRAAAALGVDRDAVVTDVAELGDTGAASAPLGLARALAEGARTALLVGYGSGAGASALRLEATGSVPVDLDLGGDIDLTYPGALRRRGEITGEAPDGGGAYVSVPRWRASHPQRHRLEAGRCPECGALGFPPAGACRTCGDLVEYTPVPLPRTGTVEAVTRIERGGEPPEFVPQQARGGPYASAVVAFEGPAGGSVSVPVQAVLAGGETLAVGDRVESTFRRLYEQEGVLRYAMKVRPADAG